MNNNGNIEWSLYWAQDRLHSCVAANKDIDQLALNEVWKRLACGLPDGAKVLDLATGNGAVPRALLEYNDTFSITAVDRAEIAPLQFLSEPANLKLVDFVANTDIKEMAFEPAVFSAVTSQYGIEYAGLHSAIELVLPLLMPGGKLKFLIHHADSEIVKSSQKKVIELSELVKPDGLLDELAGVVRGHLMIDSLEQSMRAFRMADGPRSEQISGQIFSGIQQIVSLMASDRKGAETLEATLGLRVRAEHARLLQMVSVAQAEDSLVKLCTTLESSGFEEIEYQPYFADDDSDRYLLGWIVDAQKKVQAEA